MKQTYEAIQAAIRDARECQPTGGPESDVIDEIVDNLVYYLKDRDHSFKAERFRRGCDPVQWKEDMEEEGWL